MAAMLVIKGAAYTEKDVYPDGNQEQVFLLINEHLMQNHAISGSSSQAHEICVLRISLKSRIRFQEHIFPNYYYSVFLRNVNNT